ncbi:CidA/LrgA family protein [uncultured Microbulbifer sp.]|uniref:CidA/LrgA family protein n=1 Tax=uncultured Microbulbifer sp. TaxID=348147 RepID=UPI002624FBF6|nr:CidA/LrgA family protein [uncultured Microbulbifer sp.]
MAQLKKLPRWLLGAGLLVAFDLTGRTLTSALSLPVPGPVLGMLLLLLALMLYGRVPRGLAEVAEQLLRYLVLILLPATVGIYFLRDLAINDWIALAVAMVVGTLISFTLTALLLNHLIRRRSNPQGEDTNVE